MNEQFEKCEIESPQKISQEVFEKEEIFNNNSPQLQKNESIVNQQLPSNEDAQLKNGKEEKKGTKKKVKHYLVDFKEYLPQFLVSINKTHAPALIRLGERYQAEVPKTTSHKYIYKSMKAVKIWSGSSDSSIHPSKAIMRQFRQHLGQNRTEEELIHLYLRNNSNWEDLMIYILKNKIQLRKIFRSKAQ